MTSACPRVTRTRAFQNRFSRAIANIKLALSLSAFRRARRVAVSSLRARASSCCMPVAPDGSHRSLRLTCKLEPPGHLRAHVMALLRAPPLRTPSVHIDGAALRTAPPPPRCAGWMVARGVRCLGRACKWSGCTCQPGSRAIVVYHGNKVRECSHMPRARIRKGRGRGATDDPAIHDVCAPCIAGAGGWPAGSPSAGSDAARRSAQDSGTDEADDRATAKARAKAKAKAEGRVADIAGLGGAGVRGAKGKAVRAAKNKLVQGRKRESDGSDCSVDDDGVRTASTSTASSPIPRAQARRAAARDRALSETLARDRALSEALARVETLQAALAGARRAYPVPGASRGGEGLAGAGRMMMMRRGAAAGTDTCTGKRDTQSSDDVDRTDDEDASESSGDDSDTSVGWSKPAGENRAGATGRRNCDVDTDDAREDEHDGAVCDDDEQQEQWGEEEQEEEEEEQEEGEEEEQDEEEQDDEDDLGEWAEIADDHEYFVPKCPEDWRVGSYRILDRLQWGGFGSVFSVRHVVSKVPFAMKVYRLGTDENVAREHDLLVSIRHENVMAVSKLRTFYARGSGYEFQYAVMPLYPKDLAQFIHGDDDPPPSRAQIHSIMMQICGGLGAIHATHHVHADLKPENILVNDVAVPGKVHACICDFGSVLDLTTGGPYDEFGHTLMLSAPELVCACDGLIGFGLDVFALGCIYTELCAEQSLFNEKKGATAHLGLVAQLNPHETFPPAVKSNTAFFNRRGHLRSNTEADQLGKMDNFFACNPIDAAQREFIRWCCRLDPAARPTLDRIVSWLDTYYAADISPAAGAAPAPDVTATEACTGADGADVGVLRLSGDDNERLT